MILLVDNYDSFTYNLAHLFGELGAEVVVRRNDAITVEEAEALAPSHLVISPGPGRPSDSGVSPELIRRVGPRVPTLGVCLGHQAIVEVFGGDVGQARRLVHGKASPVTHSGEYPAHPARSRATVGIIRTIVRIGCAPQIPNALFSVRSSPISAFSLWLLRVVFLTLGEQWRQLCGRLLPLQAAAPAAVRSWRVRPDRLPCIPPWRRRPRGPGLPSYERQPAPAPCLLYFLACSRTARR